jgi:hypothetical protein
MRGITTLTIVFHNAATMTAKTAIITIQKDTADGGFGVSAMAFLSKFVLLVLFCL